MVGECATVLPSQEDDGLPSSECSLLDHLPESVAWCQHFKQFAFDVVYVSLSEAAEVLSVEEHAALQQVLHNICRFSISQRMWHTLEFLLEAVHSLPVSMLLDSPGSRAGSDAAVVRSSPHSGPFSGAQAHTDDFPDLSELGSVLDLFDEAVDAAAEDGSLLDQEIVDFSASELRPPEEQQQFTAEAGNTCKRSVAAEHYPGSASASASTSSDASSSYPLQAGPGARAVSPSLSMSPHERAFQLYFNQQHLFADLAICFLALLSTLASLLHLRAGLRCGRVLDSAVPVRMLAIVGRMLMVFLVLAPLVWCRGWYLRRRAHVLLAAHALYAIARLFSQSVSVPVMESSLQLWAGLLQPITQQISWRHQVLAVGLHAAVPPVRAVLACAGLLPGSDAYALTGTSPWLLLLPVLCLYLAWHREQAFRAAFTPPGAKLS